MRYLIILLLTCFSACHGPRPISSVTSKDYAIGKAVGVDSTFLKMLQPYTDSVGKTMNEVLVFSSKDLTKEVPNSSLGNFLADAYLTMARDKFNKEADIAFMNHGGVRINRIPAGPVMRGTIYEVMPFDNLLVLVQVKGDVLQAYLDKIASEGGGGGIAGMTMRISNNKATDVMIGGKPIDLNKVYIMVNSDYTVDGGGGFAGLKKLPQQRMQYLLRDAILAYCSMQKKEGKQIGTESQARITNE